MSHMKHKQIVLSINLIAQLPEDDSYVHVIGNGTETSNYEAIDNWINRQEDLLELTPSQYRLQKLVERLRQDIAEFYDHFSL